jgi:uncharacterized membrane protein
MNELVEFFQNFPVELAVFLIALLPISELRGAIPVGIGLGLSWQAVVLIAIAGNMVPVVFLLWLLEPFSKWLRRNFKLWDRFFSWLFERTRKRYYDRFERLGDLALVLFVAIPLPVTGAWTGSVAAFVFGVPRVKAFFLILIGVVIAASIVTAITLGAFAFV